MIISDSGKERIINLSDEENQWRRKFQKTLRKNENDADICRESVHSFNCNYKL